MSTCVQHYERGLWHGRPHGAVRHHGQQDGGLRKAHAGWEVARKEGRREARQQVQYQVVVDQVVAVCLQCMPTVLMLRLCDMRSACNAVTQRASKKMALLHMLVSSVVHVDF